MRALLLIALLGASSAYALDIDWKTYFRGPVGTNAQGGKQIQLVNPGSRGNEFRLGNEVAYGESYFWGHVLKPTSADDAYFDFNLTLGYSPAMNAQYGDTGNADGLSVIQAFAEGGNVDGIKASYWAGKRFYRDVDVHENDFFYFADMSGVGAGVEKIPLAGGTLAVAYLQHSDISSYQNTVNGTPPGLEKTTNGIPSKQALDVRLFGIPVSSTDKLNFWGAYGYSAPGTGVSDGTGNPVVDYQAGQGGILGVRWERSFGEKQFNNLAAMYGTGVLDSFNMENSYMTPGTFGTSATYVPNNCTFGPFPGSSCDINKRKRWRVVDNPVIELGEKWALSAVFVYESANSGAPTDPGSKWMSVGVRPVYYFTDHIHLSGEVGYSDVKVDSEHAGDRTMGRVTIAPEVAMGKGFFNRPTIRAYVTHTWWNAANSDITNQDSLVGFLNAQNITALNGQSGETQIGFEAEVWF